MRDAGCVVVLGWLLACSGARSKPSPPDRTSCLPLAEANAAASAAGARNEARYQQELAARQLVRVILEDRKVPANTPMQPGTITTVEREGKPVRALIGPPTIQCGGGNGWELVKNPSGAVFSIERRPQRKQPDYYTACGCQEHHYTCGGAAQAPMQFLYTLPEGVTYEGSVVIEYEEEPTTVLFTGRLADGKDCPREDPPP